MVGLWRLLNLCVFFLVDVVALSFVRRGNSGAVMVIKNDALGDYLLLRNFLQAVRDHPPYQGKKIVFCGSPAVRELAETFDRAAVDEFVWIDQPKFDSQLRERFRVLRVLKRIGADVTLYPSYYRSLMPGDSVVRATGARERIGFAVPPLEKTWSEKTGWIDWKPSWLRKLGDRFYTRLIPVPDLIFEFERNRFFFPGGAGGTLRFPTVPGSNRCRSRCRICRGRSPS